MLDVRAVVQTLWGAFKRLQQRLFVELSNLLANMCTPYAAALLLSTV
jgi:hypothetical protein